MIDREPVVVIILAWERPIYLWLTLDSLYRHTSYPVRFVIIDNGSKHPMVREVIEAFDRRGMFERVVFGGHNDPNRLQSFLDSMGAELPERFVYVEGDVEILPGDVDWLAEYIALSDADPAIHYLGSLIDAGDFVSLEDARRLSPDMDDVSLAALAKLHSPERSYPQGGDLPRFIEHLQPPGRLCLYRHEQVRQFGVQTDGRFTELVRAHGGKAGIASRVRHRHLSLLHVFDEPRYDTSARNAFFQAIDKPLQ